jgi:serine/threonine-protein kinase
MFEILTGKQLFDVPATAGKAPPPSSLRPEVPPEVDRIVGKALQELPDDRYQTAREMRDDLERLLTAPPERIDDYLMRLFGKDRMLERTDVLSLLRRRTPVTPWTATPSPSSSLVSLPLGSSTAPEPGGDSPRRFHPT